MGAKYEDEDTLGANTLAIAGSTYIFGNIPTGILESVLPKLAIYPNPTSGLLTVELGQLMDEVVVSVKNTLGQEVYHKLFNSANLLQIELDAPKGIYFVTLSSKNQPIALLKVIKQ